MKQLPKTCMGSSRYGRPCGHLHLRPSQVHRSWYAGSESHQTRTHHMVVEGAPPSVSVLELRSAVTGVPNTAAAHSVLFERKTSRWKGLLPVRPAMEFYGKEEGEASKENQC